MPRLPPADSNAVLVDVVVRDGKGRPVTDLAAADFEVLEDGVPQVIGQFAASECGRGGAAAQRRRLRGRLPPCPAQASATAAAGHDRLRLRPPLHLRAGGRHQGRAGHLEGRTSPLRAGFSIEARLVVLQDFTPDQAPPGRARRGRDRVAHAGDTQMPRRRSAQPRRAADRARVSDPRSAPGTGGIRAWPAPCRRSPPRSSPWPRPSTDAFDLLARDEHGFATAHALTAIVDALRTVPGRKAMVLFSGGLFRTEATENRFLSVIHSANRASVSVYAVEAAGLSSRATSR